VPVAVKDIFDTADMPTEYGSPIHAGRTPSRDATAVALLRGAGAVIMGKAVTTEFAFLSPGKTRNPHNPAYTPGGSSSGSAAAVAANMVPLAIGSQTAGSTIRPASLRRHRFQPTHGLISGHRGRRYRGLSTMSAFATPSTTSLLAGSWLPLMSDPTQRAQGSRFRHFR
jgi:Asp-tRNA(Asn)/Glu-tRNA(Gln) amidotransferase A subunit family amidase